jgi:hypothetical protein
MMAGPGACTRSSAPLTAKDLPLAGCPPPFLVLESWEARASYTGSSSTAGIGCSRSAHFDLNGKSRLRSDFHIRASWRMSAVFQRLDRTRLFTSNLFPPEAYRRRIRDFRHAAITPPSKSTAQVSVRLRRLAHQCNSRLTHRADASCLKDQSDHGDKPGCVPAFGVEVGIEDGHCHPGAARILHQHPQEPDEILLGDPRGSR